MAFFSLLNPAVGDRHEMRHVLSYFCNEWVVTTKQSPAAQMFFRLWRGDA